MRWVFGFLLGVIGVVIGLIFFGDLSIGGELGTDITMFACGIGLVIGAPIGFILGSILDTLVSTSKQKSNKTVAHFAPQIAGSEFSVCGERVLLITDGRSCEHCHSVFHLACESNNACPNCHIPNAPMTIEDTTD